MQRAAALALLMFAGAGAVQAAPPPGALGCAGCHQGAGTALPSLAALSAEDITAAMQQFRSGARPSTLMGRLAKGFSEEETRAIAAWLAATKGGTDPALAAR